MKKASKRAIPCPSGRIFTFRIDGTSDAVFEQRKSAELPFFFRKKNRYFHFFDKITNFTVTLNSEKDLPSQS